MTRFFLIVLGLGLGALRVEGCSMPQGYIRPTNYEMVKEARAIVLAEAISFRKEGSNRRVDYGQYSFRILERLKGDCAEEVILDEGDTRNYSWGDANNFGVYKGDTGPCNAANYRVGGKYVLLLDEFKKKWSVSGPSFSRVNVEVKDGKAPWTEAVRRYVEVAALKDYEKEKVGLRRLKARAENEEVGCPKGLAKDIDAHFAKATDAKSGADLLELFQKAGTEEEKERALWAFANRGEPAARALFLKLFSDGTWLDFAGPACAYASAAKLQEASKTMAEAMPTIKTEWMRRQVIFGLGGVAGEEDRKVMWEILQTLSDEESVYLGGWFAKHSSEEVLEHYRKRSGKDYAENTEFTFILTRMGDKEVVDWANKFKQEKSENRWVAFYVLAQSPLQKADQEAQEIINGSDGPVLISLTQAYGGYDFHSLRSFEVRLLRIDGQGIGRTMHCQAHEPSYCQTRLS